jgi:hypothetical protein
VEPGCSNQHSISAASAAANSCTRLTAYDESNNSRSGNSIDITAVLIADVQLQGQDIVLSFATVAGKSFRVERTENLQPPVAWTPVNSAVGVAGTGGILVVTDFGALAQPMRFYRVRLLE